jgi:hypothetical protein
MACTMIENACLPLVLHVIYRKHTVNLYNALFFIIVLAINKNQLIYNKIIIY